MYWSSMALAMPFLTPFWSMLNRLFTALATCELNTAFFIRDLIWRRRACRRPNVVVARNQHEPQGPRFLGLAAAEDSASAEQNVVLLGIGRWIDHQRPLGQAKQLAMMELIVVENGHFHQSSFQQISAAQTGRFALRRDADFDVEMVAFLYARSQIGLHQHH